MTIQMIWVEGTEEGRVGISEDNPVHPNGLGWVVGGEGPVKMARTPMVMERLNKGLLKEVAGPKRVPRKRKRAKRVLPSIVEEIDSVVGPSIEPVVVEDAVSEEKPAE